LDILILRPDGGVEELGGGERQKGEWKGGGQVGGETMPGGWRVKVRVEERRDGAEGGCQN